MRFAKQPFNVSHPIRKRKERKKKRHQFILDIYMRSKDKLNIIHLQHIRRPSIQSLYILQGVQIE